MNVSGKVIIPPGKSIYRFFGVALFSEIFLIGLVFAIKRDFPSGRYAAFFVIALLMLLAMWLRARLSRITLEKDEMFVKQGLFEKRIKYISINSIENSKRGLLIDTNVSKIRFYEIDKENFALIRAKAPPGTVFSP